MSNTQKKVPELRFPGFEGEWEEKKLGEVTTKIGSGKTPKGGSENYTNKGIPFLRSQNIRNGKLNLNDLVYISKDIDDEMKNSRTYYGDVLLNITGASIGRTAINSIVETHANLNQHVCIIRLKKEYYYNFFEQYLLSRKGKRKIFLAQSGGSREGLNFKEIANLKIFTSTIFEEQQKVGKFFSKLDRQIELEEQKLELLQQQKKGYMQKIFSQELRFKDENGNEYPEWKVTSIQDVTKYTSSKKSSNQYADKIDSKGYPVYDAVREIGKDSNYDIEESYISILKDGAGVGRLNLRPEKSSVIGTMGYLQANNIDLEFLYYRMKIVDFKKYIIGSTIPHLYFKDYSKETIYIPSSIQEQAKIGKFISNLDKMIENKTRKLNCLKQLKQGLLQGMFI
ncbi:restriction endonuclease subunit S [Staphylococcus schweitzeri]|uniref:Restriction endonuclease subunit S n=1 Tax=Staphylococcus schweitzeri TaxID=1654388 RepID=A0A2K4AIT4_9STAP|nr:restriction endonuclease subunit S [Staphylococcus schweitzeri]MBE2127505.1 restriction endonuclease subunit S [Staphylococcus schweitzeri]PNZ50020.1 restriction endonuclease subunit S [Staphylococcus schweitzeri]CDR53057.1 type I restriction-modification enzyme%2C S subunit%2C EcoA family protein [Staphylococcus schweitzeri]VEE64984.1 EcoKI restriction-modification system protein HsdS [Staphylococcus schweitzeri]